MVKTSLRTCKTDPRVCKREEQDWCLAGVPRRGHTEQGIHLAPPGILQSRKCSQGLNMEKVGEMHLSRSALLRIRFSGTTKG
jgi:hypothetical protein